jgi:hypothetical protein
MFPLEQLIWSQTGREASQVLALLHGLHDLSPTLGFPECHSRNPVILHQQWVEEAQQGADQQFMQRVQQLNGYLDLLPCLFYSERVTKLTKVVEPFDDPYLVIHILRMFPRNWQDQYKLTEATVPQSVRKLLEALEHIEKAFPTKKEHKGPMARVTGGGSSKKSMAAFSD